MNNEAPTLTVCFYRTGAGSEPVRDWLASLPREQKRLIGTHIMTVQIGWPVGMPLARKLEKALWETRINLEDTTARVLFTAKGNTTVLLHGFIKKSQKTPTVELETARRRQAALEQYI
ncbi:type II toxin-antitoxin system RelE/ParE family toxin [Pseudomonas sp. NPDC089401]|uniref:type II toxin-antitoxin system RelE/ParE family toxin n=1 Tax=Pseudomonas sp. NPDC089401 TaxID=3364462 RepID=UPI003811F9EF